MKHSGDDDSSRWLIRPTTLAQRLSVHLSTIWRWYKAGVIPPPSQIGGIHGWTKDQAKQIQNSIRARSIPTRRRPRATVAPKDRQPALVNRIPSKPTPQLLDRKETAQRLRCSVQTVRRREKDGILIAIRSNQQVKTGKVFYAIENVRAVMAGSKFEPEQ